ncbi:MAG: DUF1501 domain-containing protein [Planctomycetaceae bacterium]|nr:DUF1501 domain-containing protein [Planctomycetaceae bacterium]MCB9949604.1 DUF1501 domain-containing protein [Planctomycetaceae bacterium]
MLSLVTGSRGSRREFLRIGGLALGGLTLPALLQAQQALGETSLARPKSVVFLFMHGGPSQVETFDPKMNAPVGIASATGEVSTKLPGVTFGGTFPKLASLADLLSVVRSFTTGDGNHDIKPIVGKSTGGANIGSLYSRIVGANKKNGMPTNVALYPQAVDDSTQPVIKNFGDFESTGPLGAGYAPFAPSGGGTVQENLKLQIEPARLDDRRTLLTRLDNIRREMDVRDRWAGMDAIREQAYSTMLGGVADAFDLSKESADTIERYDTAPVVRPNQIDKKWNNYNHYCDNAKSLGKLLLLARRLCERGAGFVTVTTSFVWDMHSDSNNAGVEEGMRYMGHPFDHAVSAFIEDVHNRGLQNDILLVCCGEMGRTPKINARGGRDHWGGLAPLLLSGGGLPMGHVVGQSTSDASRPMSTPIGIPNLVSTVLGTLVDIPQLRLKTGVPNEVLRAATVDPIPFG